ncbi:MAG: potassium channel family protein [Methylocystaceae bacterium]
MKKKMVCVIGLGRFGRSVAITLTHLGHEVLGIDTKEALVDQVKDIVTQAIVADAREEKVMEAIGIRNFDTAVVAIGDDIQASILVTLLLKEHGVARVITKAVNEVHGKVLEKVGADQVVYPEREMGEKIAHFIDSSNILNYIDLSDDYSIIEADASRKMWGHTLREIDLRTRLGVSVLAVRRSGGVFVAPDGDFIIQANDRLIVLGETSKVEKFSHSF